MNGTAAIDLLVCRNVTIYFDAATTRQVVERFFSALAPGGWLIVGHSEPQASVYQQFEVHNFPHTVVYRKPLDAPLFTLDGWSGPELERPGPPVGGQRPSALAPAGARSAGRKATGPLHALDASPGPLRESQPDPKSSASPDLPRERRGTSELRLASSAEVAALIKLGRQCADCGDWPGAETYCEQALAFDSLCLDAHYLLAQIYEHQGALDPALAAYRRTVYLDRGFVPGLIGMGNIWRQIGRLRDARRYYEMALRQLSQLPSMSLVPGAEGATAGELEALVSQQLRVFE